MVGRATAPRHTSLGCGATGREQQPVEMLVESVWSGPDTHRVPVRATAQVLLELINEAQRELLMLTYSAKPYPAGAGGAGGGGRP
jgi:hypothetical protein